MALYGLYIKGQSNLCGSLTLYGTRPSKGGITRLQAQAETNGYKTVIMKIDKKKEKEKFQKAYDEIKNKT